MKHLQIFILIFSISLLGTSCTKKKKSTINNQPAQKVIKAESAKWPNREIVVPSTSKQDDDWLKEKSTTKKENKNESEIVVTMSKKKCHEKTTTTSDGNKTTDKKNTSQLEITENKTTCKDGVCSLDVKKSVLIEEDGKKMATITKNDEKKEYEIFIKNDLSKTLQEEQKRKNELRTTRKEKSKDLKEERKDKIVKAKESEADKKEVRKIRMENAKEAIEQTAKNTLEATKETIASIKVVADEREENRTFDKASKFAEKHLNNNEIEAEVFATEFISKIENEDQKKKVLRRYKTIFQFASRENIEVADANLRAGLELSSDEAKDFADKMLQIELAYDTNLLTIYKKAFKKALGDNMSTTEAQAEADKALDQHVAGLVLIEDSEE